MRIQNRAELIEAIDLLHDGRLKYEDVFVDVENLAPDLSHFVITFRGDKLHGTITAPIMEAMLDLQGQVYKSYADIRYDGNVRKLTKQDREKLQLVIDVEDGSTELIIAIRDILNQLQSMPPEIYTTIALVLAGAYVLKGGIASGFKYLIEKQKQKLEHEQKLAQNEVEQARIRGDIEKLNVLTNSLSDSQEKVTKLADVLSKNAGKSAVVALERAEDTAKTVAKVAQDIDEVQFGRQDAPIVLKSDVAEIVGKSITTEWLDARLDGTYRVNIVNSKSDSSFKVGLRDVETGEEITATVQDDLKNAENKSLLSKAEWNKQPLYLKINAKQNEGKIKDAIILQAEWIDAPAEEI